MYKAYNLRLANVPLLSLTESVSDAADREYRSTKQRICGELSEFIQRGSLSASLISREWFPDVEADIFLSHAHKDEEMAIKLAYMLKQRFGLKVFVDSMVWRNCNDLLKLLDNEYAPYQDKATGKWHYDYNTRNQTTAHVHMLLATALQKMMDRCECTFFLNTPRSLSNDSVTDSTYSPWIYFELLQTNILRRVAPEQVGAVTESFSNYITDSVPQIRYDVDLSNMTKLNSSAIREWYNEWYFYTNQVKGKRALDILYKKY